jgi:opacity protein-like surface antigen
MKNIKKYVAGMVLATTVVSLSLASEGYYVKGEIGVSASPKLNGQNFDFTRDMLKKSALFGFEAGQQLNQKLRFGLNFGYQNNKAEKISKTDYGQYTDSFELGSIKSMNAMANVYYDILKKDGVSPYLKLSVGISRNKIGASKMVEVSNGSGYGSNPSSNPGVPGLVETNEVIYKGGSKTGIAWGVGAGVTYDMSEKMSLDFGYMYKDLGQVTAKIEGTPHERFANEYKVPQTYKANLRTHNVSVGVMFKF